ncbi:hypothetical protein CC80DRAFT_493718 [Byssothecium circinans]|uniref:ABM domain-containing protein n=1 Tax=Byssothecium circinans TaxID=147558 RepID=A0A6A5TPM5_9PLEO|nr:hypothetical protein CC80DRAFT_493718 [Byssothecium circinans]
MSTPTSTSTSSFSLHVTYYINPAKADDFLAALRPAYEGVIAEPECIFFEVYTSRNEPGTFKLVENWNATEEWMMNVQLKKDYYKPYLAAIESMQVKPREFEILTRMAGNEWVSVSKEMLS